MSVGAVMLLIRLEYKTSVICHNVNTQTLKIARRDKSHILTSLHRCEAFENLLHTDIAPVGELFNSGISKLILKLINNSLRKYKGN